MNKNNFASRLGQHGRPTTFGELRNGDLFRISGLHDTEQDVIYRKTSAMRAEGSTNPDLGKDVPANWPVVLVETVIVE